MNRKKLPRKSLSSPFLNLPDQRQAHKARSLGNAVAWFYFRSITILYLNLALSVIYWKISVSRGMPTGRTIPVIENIEA